MDRDARPMSLLNHLLRASHFNPRTIRLGAGALELRLTRRSDKTTFHVFSVLFRVGKLKLLVTRPHTFAYGHLCLDILTSMKMAQKEGAFLHVLRPGTVANTAVFHLESDEVKVLRRGWPSIVPTALWYLIQSARWPLKSVRALARLFHGTRAALRDGMKGGPLLPSGKRRDLYLQRALIKDPATVRLSPRHLEMAADAARELGIPPEGRVVSLHVREAGFKQDKYKMSRDESARNARIETYFEAVELLAGLDCTVVRLGDPSMSPFDRPGLIDLATSPLRTDLLELFCLMRSEFLIGCESGPYHASYLTNTPAVIVNGTDPINTYPIRRDRLYILKHVYDHGRGRNLSLAEMLSKEYYDGLRDTNRYEYVDNSSEDILEAVREMMDLLERAPPKTDAQREYERLALHAARDLQGKVFWVTKWGLQDGFLGEGSIAHFFAERFLHA